AAANSSLSWARPSESVRRHAGSSFRNVYLTKWRALTTRDYRTGVVLAGRCEREPGGTGVAVRVGIWYGAPRGGQPSWRPDATGFSGAGVAGAITGRCD